MPWDAGNYQAAAWHAPEAAAGIRLPWQQGANFLSIPSVGLFKKTQQQLQFNGMKFWGLEIPYGLGSGLSLLSPGSLLTTI